MEENFSHIQLPNFVLANWFKHHLIEEEATSTITKTSNTNTSISFLGNNKKNIVLIVCCVVCYLFSEKDYWIRKWKIIVVPILLNIQILY